MKKLRILVVDDDRGALIIIGAWLENEGYEVFIAANGSEGLDRIEAEGGDVDLVLSDIIMPVMDGLEMLERLMVRRPEIPVIMISGQDELAIRNKAIENGAKDFLIKPVSFDALRRAIAETMTT